MANIYLIKQGDIPSITSYLVSAVVIAESWIEARKTLNNHLRTDKRFTDLDFNLIDAFICKIGHGANVKGAKSDVLAVEVAQSEISKLYGGDQ